MLDYEKLDVYQRAIEYLAFVFEAIPKIPRGFVGKTSGAERNNRYAIARGEAMECGAIMDVVRLLDVVPQADLATARQTLIRIVGMLEPDVPLIVYVDVHVARARVRLHGRIGLRERHWI